MLDQIAMRARLDACEYLYLDQFEPSAGNVRALRIEVLEGRVGDRQAPVATMASHQGRVGDLTAVADIMSQGSRPIEVGPGCANFVITFDRYLSFCARDETYLNPEEHEDYSKRLRTYEKSRFLDFFNASTSNWALDGHIGPLKHHAVVCLNVVIDVISEDDPVITMTTIE